MKGAEEEHEKVEEEEEEAFEFLSMEKLWFN